jgi:site-specific DNA-adenine methylase
MTVIVTKMPGGVAGLFNPETGKVTYKAKTDTAYLNIESFGGIVKFNKKGSKATIIGTIADLQDCEIIQSSSPKYKSALLECLKAEKSFLENKKETIDSELSQLDKKISSTSD